MNSYSPTQKCKNLKIVNRDHYSMRYGQRLKRYNCPNNFFAKPKNLKFDILKTVCNLKKILISIIISVELLKNKEF